MEGAMGERATWLPHDADLLLEARAPSVERLFAVAAGAVVEAMTDRPPEAGDVRRRVRLGAGDLEALFVAWLNEIVYLVAAEGFVPARFPSIRIEEATLHAELRGGTAEVVREIKAATFHGLAVRRDGPGWMARVVLDV